MQLVITMNDIKEIEKLDQYISDYLRDKSYLEQIQVCENILKLKPIKGLDNYSKELLSLALEKKMVVSIERNCKLKQKPSFWNEFKMISPVTYQENNNLVNYINLFLYDFAKYKEITSEKLKEIEDFYNKIIFKASRQLKNRLFRLPSSEKVSVNDLEIAIKNSFDTKETIMKIIRKNGKIKNITAIATLTSLIAITAILNQEQEQAKENDSSEKLSKQYVAEMTQEINKEKVIEIPTLKKVFVGYDNNCPLEYQEYMYEICQIYEIPFNVLMTIVDNESNGLFDTNGVISEWNDYGLCQINICNHEDIYENLNYNSEDLKNDPYKNIEASAYLIKKICNIYSEDIKNGNYENIFGAYNGWLLWKNKQTSVEYAANAINKIKTTYNKSDEELFEEKYEVNNVKAR